MVFLFSLSVRYHTYIAKYLFPMIHNKVKNLDQITVLACELFTSGIRSWLKNIRELKHGRF